MREGSANFPLMIERVRMNFLTIRRRPMVLALFLACLGLAGVSVAGHVSAEVFGRRHWLGLRHLTSLDAEANLAAWFSACLMLIGALLFVLIGVTREVESEPRGVWFALAALFVYLSADEAASLHETANAIIRGLLGLGPDQMRWDAWDLALILLVGACFGPSLLRLLRGPSGGWFLLAGTLFVAGSVGIEFVGAHFFPGIYHGSGLGPLLMHDGEELAKLLGLVALVEGQSRLLATRGLRLDFDPVRVQPAANPSRPARAVAG